MKLKKKKLESIIDKLVDETPEDIGNSVSVGIGYVRGRCVKIEVMSEIYAKEEEFEVLDKYDCIKSGDKK